MTIIDKLTDTKMKVETKRQTDQTSFSALNNPGRDGKCFFSLSIPQSMVEQKIQIQADPFQSLHRA